MTKINARIRRRGSTVKPDALRDCAAASDTQLAPETAGVLSPEQREYFEQFTKEIALIHRNLDLQLRRFSQVQLQIDGLQALLISTPVNAIRAGACSLKKQPN